MVIHDSSSRVKVGIIIFAILIGIVSIFYTNSLVNHLSEREKQQISLYAKGQEFMAQAEDCGDVTFFVDDIIAANHTIPVIVTDEKGEPMMHRNLKITDSDTLAFLKERIKEMQTMHPPVIMQPDKDIKYYLYYSDSELIAQLKYFPYVQLTVILIFFVLVFFIFSSSRRAEQNRVWAGLAKETAHQLGTPLSSLMAWLDYFRADEEFDQEIVSEMQKDVSRLEMITERFSNIGSVPKLQTENIFQVVHSVVGYLRNRISSKVAMKIHIDPNQKVAAPLNRPLFEWVIENLCKNAVDAMGGEGKIDIEIFNKNNVVIIDVTDTGKGVPVNKFKKVFRAGFTTKKRGWGLGLTLVKRIVENYHEGKIYILRSEINIGTTFRIELPRG